MHPGSSVCAQLTSRFGVAVWRHCVTFFTTLPMIAKLIEPAQLDMLLGVVPHALHQALTICMAREVCTLEKQCSAN
jgi:hypothetical protein